MADRNLADARLEAQSLAARTLRALAADIERSEHGWRERLTMVTDALLNGAHAELGPAEFAYVRLLGAAEHSGNEVPQTDGHRADPRRESLGGISDRGAV